MPTLAEQITKPPKRADVIADMARFVDDEVARRSGLSGIAIKGAYALVKAIKPGFIPDVIDALLDDWAARLEPQYVKAVAAGGPLSRSLSAQAPEVADALLSVTDDRSQRTTHTSAKKAYEKLRPTAKRNVEEAVPRLAVLLEKHAPSA